MIAQLEGGGINTQESEVPVYVGVCVRALTSSSEVVANTHTRAQPHTGVKVCLYYLSSERNTLPLENLSVGCIVVLCVRWCFFVCV